MSHWYLIKHNDLESLKRKPRRKQKPLEHT